ncbi:hypothetical protein H0H93_002562 [Arthromyces matolae]|nr:hypothetical protein H0H93_002562 [Arthromyces matolae]
MRSNYDDVESHKLPKECGLDHQGQSIWTAILEAEEHALNQPNGPAAYNDSLIGIRVLGFFLLDLYKHAHDGYLGTLPYTRLILASKSFCSNAGLRPPTAADVSRPSFDRVKERVLKELGESSQTSSSAREQALLRDGYKCTLSGFYDMNSFLEFPELQQFHQAEHQEKAVHTQVAHIFSESAQDGDQNYAATVSAITEMFGLGKKAKGLYGAGINGLHNVLTMQMEFHAEFDSLRLWLEPVPGMENTYDICGKHLNMLVTPFKSKRVTFSVEPAAAAAAMKKGKTLTLPDPTLLAIRAACSRVANMAGAAEHIDQILAEDGSMADLLSIIISRRRHYSIFFCTYITVKT